MDGLGSFIRADYRGAVDVEEIGVVPSAYSEPLDPFVGATIDKVNKPPDTGRLLQWLLKKVEKPTQSIYVSSATTNSRCSKASRG